MDKAILQTPKGFRDFLPKEARQRQYLIKKIIEVLEFYGFDPIETPTLEYQEVLLGKYGDEADKLVFKFEDEGKRKVALRYDQTVPVARVLAQYQGLIPMPFKRYQVQPAFRAENTQKGRYREFLQFDLDIFGAPPPLPDAELLAIAFEVYKNLGVRNLQLKINDRQDLFSTLDEAGIPQSKQLRATQIIDKLDKRPRHEILTQLADLAGKPAANAVFTIFDRKTEASGQLAQIIATAVKLGAPKDQLVFTPYLARGLDYYTDMIIEGVIADYPAGSVLGGGRFDKLISQLSSAKVNLPAVGYSIGIDRTIEALGTLGLLPTQSTAAKVLITVFSPELADESLALATSLRNLGIPVELYPETTIKLDKQLKYADKKGIPYAVIIGDQEKQDNQATLKSLSTRTQQTIPLDKLTSILQS